jgi:transposase-like protein
LGEDAPLSASTMLRLKDASKAEYETWQQRSLAGHQYAYVWMDGIVRHEAPQYRVGRRSPPAVCRSRPLKLEAA